MLRADRQQTSAPTPHLLLSVSHTSGNTSVQTAPAYLPAPPPNTLITLIQTDIAVLDTLTQSLKKLGLAHETHATVIALLAQLPAMLGSLEISLSPDSAYRNLRVPPAITSLAELYRHLYGMHLLNPTSDLSVSLRSAQDCITQCINTLSDHDDIDIVESGEVSMTSRPTSMAVTPTTFKTAGDFPAVDMAESDDDTPASPQSPLLRKNTLTLHSFSPYTALPNSTTSSTETNDSDAASCASQQKHPPLRKLTGKFSSFPKTGPHLFAGTAAAIDMVAPILYQRPQAVWTIASPSHFRDNHDVGWVDRHTIGVCDGVSQSSVGANGKRRGAQTAQILVSESLPTIIQTIADNQWDPETETDRIAIAACLSTLIHTINDRLTEERTGETTLSFAFVLKGPGSHYIFSVNCGDSHLFVYDHTTQGFFTLNPFVSANDLSQKNVSNDEVQRKQDEAKLALLHQYLISQHEHEHPFVLLPVDAAQRLQSLAEKRPTPPQTLPNQGQIPVACITYLAVSPNALIFAASDGLDSLLEATPDAIPEIMKIPTYSELKDIGEHLFARGLLVDDKKDDMTLAIARAGDIAH